MFARNKDLDIQEPNYFILMVAMDSIIWSSMLNKTLLSKLVKGTLISHRVVKIYTYIYTLHMPVVLGPTWPYNSPIKFHFCFLDSIPLWNGQCVLFATTCWTQIHTIPQIIRKESGGHAKWSQHMHSPPLPSLLNACPPVFGWPPCLM
jgi:hypothetical protein